MRLSTSLMALVAAVPALVSAVPMQSADLDVSGSPYTDAVRDAVRRHIELVKLGVIFIANNFEAPPAPPAALGAIPVTSESESALFTFPEIDDPDFDFDGLFGGITLQDLSGYSVAFHKDNFKLNPVVGYKTHVLCAGAQERAQNLWRFYNTIQALVDPRDPELKLQRVPAILASEYSDSPNLEAVFTNEEVSDLLVFVADDLSTALHHHLDTTDFMFDFWERRIRFLGDAIDRIQIYDHEPYEPLRQHASEVRELIAARYYPTLDLASRERSLAEVETAAEELYAPPAAGEPLPSGNVE